MNGRRYPPNGQHPEQPELPPLPPSIRTNLIAGGGTWQLDETVQEAVDLIEAAVLGGQKTVWFHADRRPLVFAAHLFTPPNVYVAWELRRDHEVEAVTNPGAVAAVEAARTFGRRDT